MSDAMVDDLVIRRAAENELVEIAKLFRLSRSVCLPFLPTLHTPQEDLGFFTHHVFAKQQLYIALDGADIVGLMAIEGDWLDHLYLHPDHIGKGIGSKLLDQAKVQSDGYLKLYCFVENERGRRFYEERGFIEVSRSDGSINEEKMPDILYEWRAS